MSVLEKIASDYRDETPEAASEMLGKATDAIKRAIARGEMVKRTIGDYLNRITDSGLASAALAVDDGNRDFSVDGRTTAVSAALKAAGITFRDDEISLMKGYAKGEAAREAAGIKKAAAVSAYRYVDSDASVAEIAEMLKAAFVNPSLAEGEKAPTPTRDNIGKAAHIAGIGTDAAAHIGEKKAGKADAVPDSETEAPETDASRVRALASELRTITEAGYTLPKAIVRHLEATIKASEAAKVVAAA